MTHFKFLHTTFWALIIALSTTVAVHAHGTLEYPGSRSWLCWLENPETPDSPACQEAVRIGGPQALYDWDSVNQGAAAGNHQAVVKDGELCSGSQPGHVGVSLAREDWVRTPLFPNNDEGGLTMIYNASAPHSTDHWRFYLTKDGWDPLKPLEWGDLDEPFCELGDVPVGGPVGDQRYALDCPMPTDKEGHHILYLVWQRNDSPEAFYSCSDVVVMDSQPTPTPTPSVTGPCASPAYSDIVAYTEGDSVVFNEQAWGVKWWVKGMEPGTDNAWELLEENCLGGVPPTSQPVTPTPSATEPAPTESPTEPSPTESPTEPSPTELAPTEPPPTEPSPTEPSTEPSTDPADVPLNVGYSAGSNSSPNSVIGLFVITASLGLLGTVKMISGREQ